MLLSSSNARAIGKPSFPNSVWERRRSQTEFGNEGLPMARALLDERSIMADATPPQPPTPPPHQQQPPFTHPNPAEPEENELTIVSHSNLFYWWPVWAVSFILGVLTMFENHVMAVVPGDAKIAHRATVELASGDTKPKQLVTYRVDPKPNPPHPHNE